MSAEVWSQSQFIQTGTNEEREAGWRRSEPWRTPSDPKEQGVHILPATHCTNWVLFVQNLDSSTLLSDIQTLRSDDNELAARRRIKHEFISTKQHFNIRDLQPSWKQREETRWRQISSYLIVWLVSSPSLSLLRTSAAADWPFRPSDRPLARPHFIWAGFIRLEREREQEGHRGGERERGDGNGRKSWDQTEGGDVGGRRGIKLSAD